jgi:hypothetical protein
VFSGIFQSRDQISAGDIKLNANGTLSEVQCSCEMSCWTHKVVKAKLVRQNGLTILISSSSLMCSMRIDGNADRFGNYHEI